MEDQRQEGKVERLGKEGEWERGGGVGREEQDLMEGDSGRRER